jgi:hypothetical protein
MPIFSKLPKADNAPRISRIGRSLGSPNSGMANRLIAAMTAPVATPRATWKVKAVS